MKVAIYPRNSSSNDIRLTYEAYIDVMLFRSLAEQLIYDCKNNCEEQEQINSLSFAYSYLKGKKLQGG